MIPLTLGKVLFVIREISTFALSFIMDVTSRQLRLLEYVMDILANLKNQKYLYCNSADAGRRSSSMKLFKGIKDKITDLVGSGEQSSQESSSNEGEGEAYLNAISKEEEWVFLANASEDLAFAHTEVG